MQSNRTRWVSPYRLTPDDRHRQTADAVTLVAAILAGTTPLPGAACTKRPEIFDHDTGDPKQAATLCNRCPAKNRCAEWAATLPPGHATGVIAGQIHRPKKYTKKVLA